MVFERGRKEPKAREKALASWLQFRPPLLYIWQSRWTLQPAALLCTIQPKLLHASEGCFGGKEWDRVCTDLAGKETPGEDKQGGKSVWKMPQTGTKRTLLDKAWARQAERPKDKEIQPIRYLFKIVPLPRSSFPNPKFPSPSFCFKDSLPCIHY